VKPKLQVRQGRRPTSGIPNEPTGHIWQLPVAVLPVQPKPGKQLHSLTETAVGSAIWPGGHAVRDVTQDATLLEPGALVVPKGQGLHCSLLPPKPKVPTGHKVQ
jgi:hypothetical protein